MDIVGISEEDQVSKTLHIMVSTIAYFLFPDMPAYCCFCT